MIDVLAIDRWSSQERGWLHRASAPAKLAAAAACIAVLVASRDVAVLALVYGALLAALMSSRLPLRPLLALSALPLAMSALFAITRLGTTWEAAIAIVEKGAITSLVLLLLVASTPAIQLFQVMRRVMPRTLAEILFLGYRSVFLLLGHALAAREAVRLRSARLSFPTRLKRNALVGALAVLRASELATEQYAAMRLRGLGASAVDGPRWRWPSDLNVVLAITLLLGASFLIGRITDAERFLVPTVTGPLLILASGVARWRTTS